jgi:hypothetical protein
MLRSLPTVQSQRPPLNIANVQGGVVDRPRKLNAPIAELYERQNAAESEVLDTLLLKLFQSIDEG